MLEGELWFSQTYSNSHLSGSWTNLKEIWKKIGKCSLFHFMYTSAVVLLYHKDSHKIKLLASFNWCYLLTSCHYKPVLLFFFLWNTKINIFNNCIFSTEALKCSAIALGHVHVAEEYGCQSCIWVLNALHSQTFQLFMRDDQIL